MALSKLVIEQRFGAIGVDVTPAHVEIEMPKLSMNITTQPPEMTIDRKSPTFKMESETRGGAPNGSGRVAESALGESVFKDGYRHDGAPLKGEARPGAENAKKRARAAYLSRRRHTQLERRGDKIRSAPAGRPKVKWDPGYINIEWSNHRINIEWEGEYVPDITVDPPYSIEIYLRDKPYFRITVEEGEVLYETGRRVDEAV